MPTQKDYEDRIFRLEVTCNVLCSVLEDYVKAQDSMGRRVMEFVNKTRNMVKDTQLKPDGAE